jgi:hypothetical protein
MTENTQPDPWDFEELVLIDKRIDTSETEAIRDRWEFGRRMLADRDGKKRLPNGYMAALVERTGKSRSELGYRIQFAERFPTEAELSNALDSFTSWHELVENLVVKPKENGETDEEFMARWRARHRGEWTFTIPATWEETLPVLVQIQADMDRFNRIWLCEITELAKTDPKLAAKHFQVWQDNQDAEDDE